MRISGILFFLLFTSYQFSEAQNTWTQKADFGGNARRSAIGFAINGIGYIGTGYDANFYDDLWRYDPVNDVWSQVASCPGPARFSAVAFVISIFAYVGTGYDVNNNFNTGDFWRYDALNNSWSQSTSLPPGRERRYASAFSTQGKGYVCNGVGPSGYLNDLWEYDASGSNWTQKADFPGAVRYECVSFNIGEFGYVGCGAMAGTIYTDFFEYQPHNDQWVQKANYPGTGGDAAAGFGLEARGFIGTGSTQGSFPTDFYEWDQLSNTWTAKANFPATGRAFGTGFSILNRGYIGLGESAGYFNDWWEYTPDSLFSSMDKLDVDQLPFITIEKNQIIRINHKGWDDATMEIFNLEGKRLVCIKLAESVGVLPSTFGEGIYVYRAIGSRGCKAGKLFFSGE